MERIIERTADGSATLFVPSLNEHYHSVKGAETESQHIFVNMGLKASHALQPRVLEIGFGTGLNALLTLKAAEKEKRTVHYTGIERYPLTWEIINELGYVTPQTPEAGYFEHIHRTTWEEENFITPHFQLKKVEVDLHQWSASANSFDLIYFDAFAPEKQPDMWTQVLFDYLYTLLDEGGILTTYCAKGVVRRMLQTAGFLVERLPGPPGGKREILRGTKQ